MVYSDINNSMLKENLRSNYPRLFGLLSGFKQKYRLLAFAWSRFLIRYYILNSYGHTEDTDILSVLDFLRRRKSEMISYDFIEEYHKLDIPIYFDDEAGYNYTVFRDKKVYFPAGMSVSAIKNSVIIGLIEQDSRSPHCYLSDFLGEIEGESAIICGASDCLFTLSIIEKFKKIYLFEADNRWVAPMRLTLRDYLGKIEIIPKFISNHDNEEKATIRLDTFWKNHNYPKISYLQADIENHEINLLRGAEEVLANNHLKMSICCYHTHRQKVELEAHLMNARYCVSFSKGYVIVWTDLPLRSPFLRKAVIYAKN